MSCQISNQEVILNGVILVIICVIFVTVGVIAIHLKGDQATCTTTKLDSTSLIVCTYKGQVLFNKEVKDYL